MTTPPDLSARVRAVCDLTVAEAREGAGLHDYDGVVPDLSPPGVADALARLGDGPAPADPHDAAHLAAAEAALRLAFGELAVHEHNPLVHIEALDVSGYDRDYAPAQERAAARDRHLARWPEAVDTAVRELVDVPADTARSLLPAARGLAADVTDQAALAAHARLVEHLERAGRDGAPSSAIGAGPLARLYGVPEATTVRLDDLAHAAEEERARLTELLQRACTDLYGRAVPLAEAVARLLADHPANATGIYTEARTALREASRFTVERGILDDPGGEVSVGPAPPARWWAMAMMSWSGPFERDTPSCYWVTPPDPQWPAPDQEAWLSVFSRATLPVITVHEVTPGHFAHSRFLRRTGSEVRRALQSATFTEGWAHDMEELMLDHGFGDGDPRITAGVALEGLVRAERLTTSLLLHTGESTLDEATARFGRHAFLGGSAARSEAARATFDPAYGRYTWGKLAIRDLRSRARERWGARFDLAGFHRALLAFGAPPLGLLDDVLEPDPKGSSG